MCCSMCKFAQVFWYDKSGRERDYNVWQDGKTLLMQHALHNQGHSFELPQPQECSQHIYLGRKTLQRWQQFAF